MPEHNPQRRPRSFRESLAEHSRRVDRACRDRLGFGIMVWRILDQLVSLGALVLAGYAIDQGAAPVLALTLAALIISGPKVAEWWLVRQDVIDPGNTRTPSDSGSE